ncbi:MAG TPA: S1C family serine protease [Chthoniobacteraceae bacterium]|nr:S1C family serine protease [Chthoniobacteraceae bacterium]
MSVRSVSKNRGRAITFHKFLGIGFLAGGICAATLAADKTGDKPGEKPAAAQNRAEATAESVSQAVQNVFKLAQASVVKVEGVDSTTHTPVVGTGFFIDPDGLIYTCYTEGTEGFVVCYGDKKYPAKLLLGDPRSGMGILKIDARTPFLPIAKSGDLPAATPVLVAGYPMGQPLTPSLGVVASIDAGNTDGTFVTRHIRANVSVKPGQGGAPLLNLKGEVVGMVVSAGDGLGQSCYALPAGAVQKIRSDFDRFGEVRHGWIGLIVDKAEAPAGGSDVVISSMIEDSPAVKSGLKTGDIVLQIGSKKVTAHNDLFDASFFLTAGDEIPIIVLRNGQKITVKVTAAAEDEPPMRLPMNADTPASVGLPLQVPH